MDKQRIVAGLIERLREQYERAIGALRQAAEGATGEDTRAESKYDTRGLESSYLAQGQSEQAHGLSRDLALAESFSFPAFSQTSPIAMGALVEASSQGKTLYYLLAPVGGGAVIEESGCAVTVLSPMAPLAGNLLGKRVGDSLSHPPLVIRNLY